ncbi:MAG: hypothetical protein ACJ71H_19085 [Nitrososphaeraceae archaeon]
MRTRNSSHFAASIERAAHGTDLKSNIDFAEMSLDQVIKILGKQLTNDYYLLFIKALHSRLSSCSTSLLGSDRYD